jgi:hypothetical protein
MTVLAVPRSIASSCVKKENPIFFASFFCFVYDPQNYKKKLKFVRQFSKEWKEKNM